MSAQGDSVWTVFVPLDGLLWPGEEFAHPTIGRIRRRSSNPVPAQFRDRLSSWEWEELDEERHWLEFDRRADDPLSSWERVNLLLLALWVTVPTPTHARLKFEWVPLRSEETSFERLLDPFCWIEEQAVFAITTSELEKAANRFDKLRMVYLDDKRLRDSLVLTLRGATNHSWQVACVCLSAAAEAMLTYSPERGLTKRLATSFACLRKTEKASRDEQYHRFERLYQVRSEIMHGRVTARLLDGNLAHLADFSDLLRELWAIVLDDEAVRRELDKPDPERQKFLQARGDGYSPPQRVTDARSSG